MKSLGIKGCFTESLKSIPDDRGGFLKIFSNSKAKDLLPGFRLNEVYITKSRKNVIRGMHFQIPPHDHGKIVICLSGAATDVLVDLRTGKDFGLVVDQELNSTDVNTVYIPRGVAHGFLSKAEDTVMAYLVETEYAPEHDRGVLWNSIEYDWRIECPILSQRDHSHPKLKDAERYF